jgi:hypothetical protein
MAAVAEDTHITLVVEERHHTTALRPVPPAQKENLGKRDDERGHYEVASTKGAEILLTVQQFGSKTGMLVTLGSNYRHDAHSRSPKSMQGTLAEKSPCGNVFK